MVSLKTFTSGAIGANNLLTIETNSSAFRAFSTMGMQYVSKSFQFVLATILSG